jgi:hypothetical protein
MSGVSRSFKEYEIVDRFYFLSSVISSGFGIIYLYHPSIFLTSWGISLSTFGDEGKKKYFLF